MGVRLSNRARTILIFAALAVPTASSAHHSFAMFETEKVVTIDAVVKEFQWTNPHVFLEVSALKNGKTTDYALECGSVNGHRRRGWTRQSFKPGDKIKVVFRPLRDRTKQGGAFVQATFPDGKTLFVGTPPGGESPRKAS